MIKKSTLAKRFGSYSVMATALVAAGNQADANSPLADTIIASIGPGQQYLLDLNNDGIADDTFKVKYYSLLNFKDVASLNENASAVGNYSPYALNTNSMVGVKELWTRNPTLLSDQGICGSCSLSGNWREPRDEKKYLGLRIKKNGREYYGWVRLTVFWNKIIIYDKGFNPVGDSSILAGQKACNNMPVPLISPQPYLGHICPLDSFSLHVHPAQSSLTYQWFNHSNEIEGVTDSVYTTSNPGSYDVVVSNGKGCDLISNSATLLIDSGFIHNTIILQNGNDLVSQLYGLKYQWFFNGILLPGDTNQVLVVNQSGQYAVGVVDFYGCYSISTSFPYSITGNGFVSPESLRLFVINHNLNVQITDASFISGMIQIFNQLGQSVLQEVILSENFTVNLESLAAGIYFVRLEKNGKQIVRKIAVQ